MSSGRGEFDRLRLAVARYMAEHDSDWREVWEQQMAVCCGVRAGSEAFTWLWDELARELDEDAS